MDLILSLETSIDVCSVALHSNGKAVGSIEHNAPQSHASKLGPMIRELLHQTNTSADDLNAIAVSAGPGSYTGLRIGVATAKGLCYGLNIPLIGLDTLRVMAEPVLKKRLTKRVAPMIDARRDEVYCAVFDEAGNPVKDPAAVIVTKESLDKLSEGEAVWYFGNGAEKCRELIKQSGGELIDRIYPTAIAMGALAHDRFIPGSFENLHTFEPFYLKAFQGKKRSRHGTIARPDLLN